MSIPVRIEIPGVLKLNGIQVGDPVCWENAVGQDDNFSGMERGWAQTEAAKQCPYHPHPPARSECPRRHGCTQFVGCLRRGE